MLRIVPFLLIAVGWGGYASSVRAGRPERDARRELEPRVVSARDSIRTACGCQPTIRIEWDSYPDALSMRWIGISIDAFVTVAGTTCGDSTKRPAFCSAARTLVVKHVASGAGVTTERNELSCNTTRDAFCGEELVSRAVGNAATVVAASASPTPLRLGHYSTVDGRDGFILDRVAAPALFQRDGTTRTLFLEVDAGGSTTMFSNRGAGVWIRVLSDGRVLYQGPDQRDLVDVRRDGDARALPRPYLPQ